MSKKAMRGCKGEGIELVLPNRPIRAYRALHRVHLERIRQNNCVTELERLLPTVLYGTLNIGLPLITEAQDIGKALALLQLSCQYAFRSTQFLDKEKRSFEQKLTCEAQRLASLQRSRRILADAKDNLERELNIVDSALDGIQMMAQVLHPENIPFIATEKRR